MKPISPVIPGKALKEIVFAKHQPEYIPLPAIRAADPTGTVTTRWHLSWRERFQILFHGDLWLQMFTFHKLLQPVKLTTKCPDLN